MRFYTEVKKKNDNDDRPAGGFGTFGTFLVTTERNTLTEALKDAHDAISREITHSGADASHFQIQLHTAE